MTKEDISALANVLATAINGTHVQVYNNDGDLADFKLEDIIDIRKDESNKKLVNIYLKNPASICYEDDEQIEVEKNSIVTVTGTVSKWTKKLNVKRNILNEEDFS